MRRYLISAAAALTLIASANSSAALQVGFSDIDGAGLGPAFASQVTLDTVIAGTDQVGFKITSAALGAGDTSGLIEQVNFDDSLNLLGSFDSFVPTNDVDFAVNLANLPQGQNVGFTSDFGFQANPPPAGNNANSIRPGDMLTIIFGLTTGFTLADVDAALGSGDLRLGIHVISFPDGSSDTLVTGPMDNNNNVGEVPLPATLPLLLGALGVLGFGMTRKRRA